MKKTFKSFLLVSVLILGFTAESNAQCGVPPTYTITSNVQCNGDVGSADIMLNLLGGPYNIQPLIDYQFPSAPVMPYATNHPGPVYSLGSLPAGTNKVYIIDAGHGYCYDSVMITMNNPAILNFVWSVQFPLYCDVNGPSDFTMAGGTPPYTISYTQDSLSWTQIVNTSSLTYNTSLPVGPYSFKVVDNNGCIEDQSHTVVGVIGDLQAGDYIGICGVEDSTLAVVASGSNTFSTTVFPLMKGLGSWSDSLLLKVDFGDNSPVATYGTSVRNSANGINVSHTYTGTGVYEIFYTAINLAKPDTVTVMQRLNINSDVYPGDCNGDGDANNFDLLHLGLGFGASGPVRSNASLNWVGQPATNWTQSFTNGLNYKHTDCDGNGSAGFSDTLGILLNYGNSHVLRTAGPDSIPANAPVLSVNFPSGTYPTGSNISLSVELGTSSVPATVYGLAFTVNYPSQALDPNSISLNFNGGWIGTPGSTAVTLSKNFPANASVDIAVSRTDQMPVTGSGIICQIGAITIDNVSGKLSGPAYISLSNVRAIDELGNEIPLNLAHDSIEVLPVGIETNNAPDLAIFPNPTAGELQVRAGEIIERITLLDVTGKVVFEFQPGSYLYTVPALAFPSGGLYFLKTELASGTRMDRVISSGR